MKSKVIFFGVICALQFISNLNAMGVRDLISAAEENNVEFINAYQGDVNEQIWLGSITTNALHQAILNNKYEAVEALLNKRADPKICRELRTKDALVVPFRNSLEEALDYRRCATWNDQMHCNPIDYMLLNLVGDDREGIIQFRWFLGKCSSQWFSMFCSLLKAGVDPNAKFVGGIELVEFAANRGWTAAACALIAAGAAPEAITQALHSDKIPQATRDAIIRYINMIQEARKRMITFALINHSRCGAGSRFNGLPQHLVKQICGYIKPRI